MAVAAEEAGVPSVVIAGTGFLKAAAMVASALGLPDLRIAEYPGAINIQSDQQIKEILEKEGLDRIIRGLTMPVEEKADSGTATSDSLGGIVYKGTLDEVNTFFFEKGWTDGLTIRPPDKERVEEFLKYTNYSLDDEIAVLPQANLRATPRNIAVNAIMAGCRPEYMPVLIAAVEAIGDPDFALMSIGTTAGLVPWLLINGPVIKQLGIESGVGLVSRGPNTAIGRALRLIISNIAGFRPGQNWMGTWGYIQPFVLAENEDSCASTGWQPYHENRGFSMDASTVTVRPTFNWGPQAFPEGNDPIPILRLACEAQLRVVCPESSLRAGPRCISTLLITPPTAQVLADNGYSKRDVADYLWQHSRITRRKLEMLLNSFSGTRYSMSQFISEGRIPKWFDVGPDETVPLMASPEQIDVVVCGDSERAKMMVLRGDYNKPVTRQVKFPARLNSLLIQS